MYCTKTVAYIDRKAMFKVQSCHGLVSTAQDQSNCQSAPVAIIMLIIKDFYQTQWYVSKLISWSTFTEFRKSTSASTWLGEGLSFGGGRWFECIFNLIGVLLQLSLGTLAIWKYFSSSFTVLCFSTGGWVWVTCVYFQCLYLPKTI